MHDSMSAVRAVSSVLLASAALSGTLLGQTFVNDPTSIPGGAAGIADTEQVDFADVDGDGDLDVALANGGDSGLAQNQLWMNQGFAQGGAIGTFQDETAARCPVLLDQSRDIDFADLDGDGDLDLHVSNSSMFALQSNRWWINMGGAQGGSAGYFADETAARWVGLNAYPSSIPASQLLVTGGFFDWSGDDEFADLDSDGDLDLVHAPLGGFYNGQEPTRLFLNDGDGYFAEFNPSGFNLGNGPFAGHQALWCEGVQTSDTTNSTGAQADVTTRAVDADVGDSDGDFDVDFIQGDRLWVPRIYHNRRIENGGALGFRDVTGGVFAAPYWAGSAKYEQEWGDLDDDGDIDLYGVNWGGALPGLYDRVLGNSGSGTYTLMQYVPMSGADEEDADFVDYDGDGDLDVMLANFSGRNQLYRNDLAAGAATLVNVSANEMPNTNGQAREVDVADTDQDGDFDALFARGAAPAFKHYFRNLSQVPDTRTPRVAKLEQAPDRTFGAAPTVVHAHVFDNRPDYLSYFDASEVEYSVNSTPFVSVAKTPCGGQLYRGEIPGQFVGSIDYRVRATDSHGNAALSVTKSYQSFAPSPVTYCTAGTTSNGCNASISVSGSPSITAMSGFTITAADVEGQKQGLLFYGLTGRLGTPWASGSSSYVCVHLPVQRMNAQNSSGSLGACDGTIASDFLAYVASTPNAYGNPFSAGALVDAQCWFRDPPAPRTTNLSNAVEFVTIP